MSVFLSRFLEAVTNGTLIKTLYRFFYISKGSIAELVTQLEIAHEIGYITHEQMIRLETDCASIEKMLNALIKSRSHP